MLRFRSLFTASALCVVFLGAVNVNAEDQQGQQCYALASLQGSYTILGHYGANVAIGLTRATLDGKGNFSSTFVVNEPDPTSTTGGRKLVTGSQTGTYTINCDGTGVITRVVTLSGGGTAAVVADLVITRAFRSEQGGLIATDETREAPTSVDPACVSSAE